MLNELFIKLYGAIDEIRRVVCVCFSNLRFTPLFDDPIFHGILMANKSGRKIKINNGGDKSCNYIVIYLLAFYLLRVGCDGNIINLWIIDF
jgi:hypothetical protein